MCHRVVYFFIMLKRKVFTRNVYVYHHNFFPQVYLIWVPKLDVWKIGIPLSKRTQNIPWFFKRFLQIFSVSVLRWAIEISFKVVIKILKIYKQPCQSLQDILKVFKNLWCFFIEIAKLKFLKSFLEFAPIWI